MSKIQVAVLRTKPSSVLDDYVRLHELAGARDHLDAGSPTILKDNISWHFPMPAANTTPWQLEGTIRALRSLGYDALSCVQNETVVIDTFKGEDLNLFMPIFEAYGIPVLYNFKPDDMSWDLYRPRQKMLALDHIYPGQNRFWSSPSTAHLCPWGSSKTSYAQDQTD